MIKYFIYALSDPKDSKIHYVGMSIDPKRRYFDHYHDAGATSTWIRELIDEGLRPLLSIIEETDVENVRDREAYWIDFYCQQGEPLENKQLASRTMPKRISVYVPYELELTLHIFAYQLWRKRGHSSEEVCPQGALKAEIILLALEEYLEVHYGGKAR